MSNTALSFDLNVRDLVHRYAPDLEPAVAIEALDLPSGGTAAIAGPSGSGKTTLAYLLTGIEPVRAGRVHWGDATLETMGEGERDRWRRRYVGMVFQDFHLIPGLSILQNVLVSRYFDKRRADAEDRARAAALLERFGVPRAKREVTDLSRGEQQRLAIARALFRQPALLVADEPTASLDAKSAAGVIEALLAAAAEMTLLCVTHDGHLRERLARRFWLEGGRLEEG